MQSIFRDGKLAITASETSSKNDFDYLVGKWAIRNRTLKEPLTGSDEWAEFDATQELRPILLGLGNFDIFHAELTASPSRASPSGCSIPGRVSGRSTGPTATR